MPGRKIVFWRPADNALAGDFRLTGDRVEATGVARTVLDAARGRGEDDGATFEAYTDWSNGVFISREVPA